MLLGVDPQITKRCSQIAAPACLILACLAAADSMRQLFSSTSTRFAKQICA